MIRAVALIGIVHLANYALLCGSSKSGATVSSTAHGLHHSEEVLLSKPSSQTSITKDSNHITFMSSSSRQNASSLQGSFSGVSMSGSGQYVATVANDAVYVSSDYGQSYSTAIFPVNGTTFINAQIAISSTTAQFMIIGCEGGLYTSTDYGLTFYLSIDALSAASLSGSWGAVTISGDGEYAYAARVSSTTPYPLYTSSSDLASFVETNSPVDWYKGLALSTDESTLYAMTNDAIYRHSLYTNTWLPVTFQSEYGYRAIATNNNGKYVAVLSSGSYDMYISNYYGKSGSWVTSTPPYRLTFDSLAMSSTGRYMFLLAKGVGVYRSSNYGASFLQTQAPPVDYQSITVSADGTSAIAVSSEGSIYQTNDNGTIWTPNHYDWVDVAVSQDGQTTFTLAGHALYGFASMSTDNGQTWLQTGYAPSAQSTVACDAKCKHIITSHLNNNYISVTANYGKSWVIVTIGGDNLESPLPALAVSSNGKYMTAGMSGGFIYRSTNYGVSWHSTSSLKLKWNDIAMSYSGQYQVAVSSLSQYDYGGGYIYVSTDYGSKWNKVSGTFMTDGWTSVASDSQGQILIATAAVSQTVYISTNSGSSWTVAPIIKASWISCSASSDGNAMYVVSSTGLLYKSTNAGVSWSHIPSTTMWSYRAVASDSTGQYLTLVAMSGPVLKSSDYGSTWTTQNIIFSTTNDFGKYQYESASNDLSAGAVAGIVIAVLCGCGCIVGLIAYLVIKYRKRFRQSNYNVRYQPANPMLAAAIESYEIELFEKSTELEL